MKLIHKKINSSMHLFSIYVILRAYNINKSYAYPD